MIDDNIIIEMFFQRSEKAIEELDKKYGKIFNRLSYNIVNNLQDVEECVSDAYFGVWNNIPPTTPNPLLTYICKIVRNVSLKAYHKKNASKRNSNYTIAMDEIENYIADSRTVEDEMDAKELAHMIEDFLDTLTLENRVIFMKRYWFFESHKEIAHAVGMTEKNVSVRLSRIRQKLKEYLVEREVFI